ncbi:alpha/beta hydrolase [Paludibacterium yongneupense]|uniref:alpha/beta hydrolase n=1 Tax=Paludibacterium yongneupense TaxID=400061 RepID=UPI000406EFC5|nr:alpha/beta fold hydrolase [Paludibacterium yongneupense]
MQPSLELVHEAARGAARARPPLLFVHGAFCAAWCWQQHFMPWFAERGFDCWALSLEGHGGSDGHHYLSAISIEDYRRNLVWAVKRLKTAPVMIGHSMGGYVIQNYLTHQPLPGVALLASVPPYGMAASSLRLMTQAPSLFMRLNLYQSSNYLPAVDELRAMLFSPDAPDETVASTMGLCQQESQRAIIDMTLVNPLGIMPLHETSALVLGAAEDRLVSPEDVVASAERLGVSAEILPHMGHMMMLDTHWEKTAERIFLWLETL